MKSLGNSLLGLALLGCAAQTEKPASSRQSSDEIYFDPSYDPSATYLDGSFTGTLATYTDYYDKPTACDYHGWLREGADLKKYGLEGIVTPDELPIPIKGYIDYEYPEKSRRYIDGIDVATLRRQRKDNNEVKEKTKIKNKPTASEQSSDERETDYDWSVTYVDDNYKPIGTSYSDGTYTDHRDPSKSYVKGSSPRTVSQKEPEPPAANIKEPEEEVKLLELLIKDNITAYDNLAAAYLHKGDKKEAANTLYSLGMLFDSIGLNNLAITELNKGLAVDPEPSFKTYDLLGRLYSEINDYEKSAEAFKKALGIAPDSAFIHNNLGLVYVKLGMHNKAKEEFEQAIGLTPSFVDARHNLAVYYYGKQDYANALKEWKMVSQVKPDYPNIDKNIELAKEKLR